MTGSSLLPSGRPDAILFDFDGVLVESADLKLEAFARLFDDRPEPSRSIILDYLAAHPGLSRFAKFSHIRTAILGLPPDEAAVAALSRRFAELVVEAVVACPAVPGAEEILRARADDTALFVVSATPEEELNAILRRRGMDGRFRATRGSPRAKADNVRDLIGIHGLDPARTLMVGDGRQDYEAAVANRIGFIGRVPAGAASPFPAGTPIVPDLTALHALWPVPSPSVSPEMPPA